MSFQTCEEFVCCSFFHNLFWTSHDAHLPLLSFELSQHSAPRPFVDAVSDWCFDIWETSDHVKMLNAKEWPFDSLRLRLPVV